MQVFAGPVGAMETLAKPLQSRVAASLDSMGMRTSPLGRQVVGDPIVAHELPPAAPRGQVPVSIEACSPAHVAPVPPGATRPGIVRRTEGRQTDVNINGTGYGRARARPAVTSSASPHRATIHVRVANGSFPQPIRLGARAVGWLESEVDGWIREQIAASGGNAE